MQRHAIEHGCRHATCEVPVVSYWYTSYKYIVGQIKAGDTHLAHVLSPARADLYGLLRFGHFRPWKYAVHCSLHYLLFTMKLQCLGRLQRACCQGATGRRTSSWYVSYQLVD